MNRKRYAKQTRNFEAQYLDGSYRDKWHRQAPAHELVTLVATGVVPSGPSLDLGCGAGVEVAYLAEQGFAAYGLDLSSAALRLAKQHACQEGVRAQFCAGSALELPFADASFSLVTDRGCLHHIRDKHRKHYAREVARVVRSGGYFMVRGVAETSWHWFIPLNAEKLDVLFSASFVLGPVQRLARQADGPNPDMLLAIMQRKER